MTLAASARLPLIVTALALSACGDDGAASTTGTSTTGEAAGGGSTTGPSTGATPTEKVYDRLGGKSAIEGIVNDTVTRVLADPKINGFFLNASVDGTRLATCLVKQLGEATGGPEVYDCKGMKEAHAGLGVSQADFDDFTAHVVAVLEARDVAEADVAFVVGALAPMATDVVEHPDSDETVYLRAGRKPGVAAVIDGFVARVQADPAINGFFGTTDGERLTTCLVRQVCGATGGPCKYGEEVDAAEPGVSASEPCRTMAASHAGLIDDMGSPITIEDFNALALHLVAELEAQGVSADDRDAVVSILEPMCKDIIATPTDCPPTPGG